METTPETEICKLRQANAEAQARLAQSIEKLSALLANEGFMEETPLEVADAVESALDDLRAALRSLESARSPNRPRAATPPGGPTDRQGQFLAFIREYMMRNEHGIAPSHADLQRFFDLTPPSVNSMLIRLEQRGFIRRVPHQPRAIQLTVDPDWIPPLDRAFRY